jgi:hypothetical protein
MSTTIPPQDRRRMNQARHWAARQEAQAARGPKGVAASWWDRARAIATQQARAGDGDAAWADLARALENWCQRYGA